MSFAESIRRNNIKRKQQIASKISTIAVELFSEVVRGTPVDKGVMKNNWHVGYGNSYNTAYNELSGSKDGMASLTRIAALKTFTGFNGRDGKVSLTNSTPYGFRAEYAGWPQPVWSGKVGKYAMIAKAFIKVIPKYKGP